MINFRGALDRLIATHPSEQVRGLMSSAGILNFATSSIALFEPIYLTVIGFSIIQVLLYYLAVYALMFLLLPCIHLVSRNLGFQHAILYSSPFLIVTYLSLYAAKFYPWFIVLAALAAAIQIVLYWPSFHGELAGFGVDGQRGKEISSVSGAIALSSILGPLFGGVMIAVVGFPALFAVASMLIIASNVPFLSIPDGRHRDGFEYRAAFRRLAAGENRRQVVSFLALGEDLISLVVWPIFIYQTLQGFTATGAVVSISLLVTTAITLFIGRISDVQSRHAVMRTGLIFLAGAWIARALARTGTAVFGADALYRVAGNTLWIPLLSMVYGRAKRASVLEGIVLFEQSLALGKILACLLGIVVLMIFPGSFTALFLLAGAFTLLYALYK